MILLKPRGRFRRLPARFDQTIHGFSEGGIGQRALDLLARDRLQDHPGVMRDLPQFGIKMPPYFVGGVIPRPMHVQREFRQRVEALDSGGQEVVYRVADARLVAHGFFLVSAVERLHRAGRFAGAPMMGF